MDGAAQIEPLAPAPRLPAPHQLRPHSSRQAFGQLMRGDDIVGIHDVPQIDAFQQFGTRRAFATAATVGEFLAIRAGPAFNVIRSARRSRRRAVLEQTLERCPALAWRGAHALNAAHEAAEPIGLENPVEALPVRPRCAEQGSQRGFQR